MSFSCPWTAVAAGAHLIRTSTRATVSSLSSSSSSLSPPLPFPRAALKGTAPPSTTYCRPPLHPPHPCLAALQRQVLPPLTQGSPPHPRLGRTPSPHPPSSRPSLPPSSHAMHPSRAAVSGSAPPPPSLTMHARRLASPLPHPPHLQHLTRTLATYPPEAGSSSSRAPGGARPAPPALLPPSLHRSRGLAPGHRSSWGPSLPPAARAPPAAAATAAQPRAVRCHALLGPGAVGGSSSSYSISGSEGRLPPASRLEEVAYLSNYDAAANAAYWETRPVSVIARTLQIALEFIHWRVRSLLLGAAPPPQPAPPSGYPSLTPPPSSLFMGGEGGARGGQAATPASLMREMLVRLGPAFIKIGQALSSRPDVLPMDYVAELELLQDRIPPFSSLTARQIIEQELGRPVTSLFSHLSAAPVAAASLGQVYQATLAGSGETVAIKVQRPGVAEAIAMDVFILRWLAALARRWGRLNTDLPSLVDEWASSLFRELDYRREALNAQRFKTLFSHMQEVYVPSILPQLTTAKVLVMEWVQGERLRTAADQRPLALGPEAAASAAAAARQDLALVEVGVRCSLEQMLEEGFYHADPHPGNLLKMADGRLAYLDFGMCGELDMKTRQALLRATLHLVNREYAPLAQDFIDLGMLPPGTNRDDIIPALTGVFQAALAGGVSSVSFSDLSGQLGRTMYQFKFRIPPYYTLLVRSLSVLEGIALAADPNYKVLGSAYPWIARRLLTDRSPELRSTLRALLYSPQGDFRFSRLESLMKEAMRTPPSQKGQGPPSLFPPPSSPSSSPGTTPGSGPGGGALALLLSAEGDFVRDILLDELAKGIDAAWRLAADSTLDRLRSAPAFLSPLLPTALLPTPLLAALPFGGSWLGALTLPPAAPPPAAAAPPAAGPFNTLEGPDLSNRMAAVDDITVIATGSSSSSSSSLASSSELAPPLNVQLAPAPPPLGLPPPTLQPVTLRQLLPSPATTNTSNSSSSSRGGGEYHPNGANGTSRPQPALAPTPSPQQTPHPPPTHPSLPDLGRSPSLLLSPAGPAGAPGGGAGDEVEEVWGVRQFNDPNPWMAASGGDGGQQQQGGQQQHMTGLGVAAASRPPGEQQQTVSPLQQTTVAAALAAPPATPPAASPAAAPAAATAPTHFDQPPAPAAGNGNGLGGGGYALSAAAATPSPQLGSSRGTAGLAPPEPGSNGYSATLVSSSSSSSGSSSSSSSNGAAMGTSHSHGGGNGAAPAGGRGAAALRQAGTEGQAGGGGSSNGLRAGGQAEVVEPQAVQVLLSGGSPPSPSSPSSSSSPSTAAPAGNPPSRPARRSSTSSSWSSSSRVGSMGLKPSAEGGRGLTMTPPSQASASGLTPLPPPPAPPRPPSAPSALALLTSSLPRLSSREDAQQVAGLQQLAAALAQLAAGQPGGAGSPTAAGAGPAGWVGPGSGGPGPGGLDTDLASSLRQTALTLRWLARELLDLSPEARVQALRLPIDLATRVSSRVAARSVRSLFLGK